MYPLPRKTSDVADLKPWPAHFPGIPLEKELADSFNAVQPEGFQGNEGSSILAAETDPDMDDTIGAE